MFYDNVSKEELIKKLGNVQSKLRLLQATGYTNMEILQRLQFEEMKILDEFHIREQMEQTFSTEALTIGGPNDSGLQRQKQRETERKRKRKRRRVWRRGFNFKPFGGEMPGDDIEAEITEMSKGLRESSGSSESGTNTDKSGESTENNGTSGVQGGSGDGPDNVGPAPDTQQVPFWQSPPRSAD